jgi:hypothetical protein
MSFFDEGDEPTRVTRPARPRTPTTGSGPPGAGPPLDPQTVRMRQAVAIGVGLLLLILLVFGVKGCLDSRKENALKDYNRDVTAVITDSDEHVSKPFFELLASGSRQANDLQVQANQYRLAAEEDLKRAKGFNVPDDVKTAHEDLLLTLSLRAGALEKIADKLPTALSRQGGSNPTATAAISEIAGQMQAFLASDVVYSQRVVPWVKEALDKNSIGGQTIAESQFLPKLNWLAPDYVASKLNVPIAGKGGTGGTIAPGTHGHGLVSVGVGALTLQPSPAVNRMPAGAGLSFDIKFQNQGQNDETDVKITVKIKGAGKTLSASRTVNQTKAGSPAEVTIPLATAPPIGQPVTITVTISAVPGEKKTDNNTQSYTAIFQR